MKLSITQIGLLFELSVVQTDMYNISDQYMLCIASAVQHGSLKRILLLPDQGS
jgi:hypothetical protein